MMSDLIASVNFTCMVNCPHCNERFDSLLTGCNDEFFIGNQILDDSTPNDKTEFDVSCPKCSAELHVCGVEWVYVRGVEWV